MATGAETSSPSNSDVPLGGWDRVFELSPLAMAVVVGGNYHRVNAALCELVGKPAEEIVGQHFSNLIDDTMTPQVDSTTHSVVEGARRVQLRGPFTRSDGTQRMVTIDAVIVDDRGDYTVVVQVIDNTEQTRIEQLASPQAEVLELIARGAELATILDGCVQLVEHNGDGDQVAIHLLEHGELTKRAGIDRYDLMAQSGHVVPMGNGKAPPLTMAQIAIVSGRPQIAGSPDEMTGDPSLRLANETLGIQAVWSQPILAVDGALPLGAITTLYRSPHRPTDHERQVTEVAASLVAIALDREEQRNRLAHLALHDPLTGLPNRTLLLDRLDHALARRHATGPEIAVLFCDIDRFKLVNDSLGHGVGDQLLSAFARRLESAADPGDTVARFGGDEFVILLEEITDTGQPVRMANRIAESLEQPFVLEDGAEVFLTVSTGMTTGSDRTTGDAWLRDADAAMYRAKERGRNRMEVFDTHMRATAMARLRTESDLRRALERGELIVYYQPVIDLVSGRIAGAEALVRWNHPTDGLLGPDAFIGIAEETGLIEPLGRQVLDLALADAQRLAARSTDRPFRLGVNVSARQLSHSGLDEVVVDLCHRHSWDPRDLVLEITETALAPDDDGPAELVASLASQGVQLAIDDFGTGFSSLTRLGELAVHQLKVDRVFVNALGRTDNALGNLVDAAIAIADALGLETVAEGVETPDQLARLRQLGCSSAQGYLFSRPIPLEQMEGLMAEDPTW